MWKHKNVILSLIVIFYRCWLIGTINAVNVDICTTLCKCFNESHFKKINCDFSDSKEYTLDDGLILPDRISAINITLGDNAKLFIRNGAFRSKNKINSVFIVGTNDNFKSTKSSVELAEQALLGIFGNLPEIGFRNLHTVILKSRSLDGLIEMNLVVENVYQLEAHQKVFGNTNFNASFSDVFDLIFKEGVLETSNYNMTTTKLFINRSYIKELNSLHGKKLTELRIENSEIHAIKTKAFSGLSEINSFVLDNVTIQILEKDLFQTGTYFANMAVTNCNIDIIKSGAIHDVGITNFSFERNHIHIINEDAIAFVGGSVNIAHNKITITFPRWFSVQQWNNMSFMNNSIGKFDIVELHSPVENAHCLFQHNTFTEPQLDCFKYISDRCIFNELIFHSLCKCDFNATLLKFFNPSIDIQSIQTKSFCKLESHDALQICFKTDIVNFDQYYKKICSKSSRRNSKLSCDHLKMKKIEANFVDPKVLSDDIDWMEYRNYIIGAGAALIFLMCTFCTIITRRKPPRSDSDHYSNRDTTNHQTDLLQLNQSEGPPSYEASLRSTKTFSSRDQNIIKRTLETMQQKQPAERYELVNSNTQRLLHRHLNEYEKVKIIGDIVQAIGECENSGEDFVAFTDILYKHLAPDTTTVRATTVARVQQPIDDLYAEPGLPQSTQKPTKNGADHIYAEPTTLMQQQTMIPLLLANQYSSPLDNSTLINNNNVYSEPIVHDVGAGSSFKPKVATPYAISQTIDLPSTSKNLPDILKRMEAGPSNELNRITRSPTSNREIPEYTVPSTSHKAPTRITQDNIEDWSDESMENSTSSNHSGGSNATVTIDELIQYTDK